MSVRSSLAVRNVHSWSASPGQCLLARNVPQPGDLTIMALVSNRLAWSSDASRSASAASAGALASSADAAAGSGSDVKRLRMNIDESIAELRLRHAEFEAAGIKVLRLFIWSCICSCRRACFALSRTVF